MESKEQELIVSLLDKDPELKRYYEEHQQLESKLSAIQHKSHLTPAEEMEKKRLQKLKLAGKDMMMQILDRHRHPRAPGESR